ncbi:hypothetical protein [Paractinoplanes atraurantiacus]|uniref:hypothetical protein n=1 Tax=Paractinoplanes atraurantiacus TaxID=1036182 RepID=UPI000BE2BE06|nr:hypothetical protein [Actinoplanes atraurantiacus]
MLLSAEDARPGRLGAGVSLAAVLPAVAVLPPAGVLPVVAVRTEAGVLLVTASRRVSVFGSAAVEVARAFEIFWPDCFRAEDAGLGSGLVCSPVGRTKGVPPFGSSEDFRFVALEMVVLRATAFAGERVLGTATFGVADRGGGFVRAFAV